MIYYEILFGACLVLLLAVHVALAAARKNADPRRMRVLHLLRSGLSLSAVSHLFRFADTPHHGQVPYFSFVTGFLGTTFLWLGWLEHARLLSERRNTHLVSRGEEDETVLALPAPTPAAGSSPLTARAREAFLRAQDEAHGRQEGCVDTDHLLLGLLRDADSAGVCLLRVLGAVPEKVHRDLLGQMASCRSTKTVERGSATALGAKVGAPALTERADQVLALAAQEAHRFGKISVSTDCLLLGLVLVGKGKAAAVLFGEGVTVDGIRSEMLQVKKPPENVRGTR